jgi:putative transcriptional regulator
MNNHIRARRTGRGWTQAELGDRVGVSRQTINAIEAGRHDPSLTLAFSLADVLEERIEALFEPDRETARSMGGAPPPR